MRPLILFVVGIAFGLAGGYLIAGGLRAAEHGPIHVTGEVHDHASHDHSFLSEWEGAAPEVTLHLWPDGPGAVNIRLDAPGFTFTPEAVNGENAPNGGHAHLYVNGEKVARMYGPYAQVTGVAPGTEIRVTLNANDHSEWAAEGVPLAATITVP